MATPKTPPDAKDAAKKESTEKPKEQTPEVEKTAPTPEELEVQRGEFLQAQFGIPQEKNEKAESPKKEAPAKDKAEPEKKEEPEKKADEEPEAKPKKRYVPPKKWDTDVDKVEEIARRVVDERSAPATPKKDEAEPSEADIENLDDQNRDTLDVLSEMESSDPARYKGLRKQAVRFWKAEEDRKKKWESENPGETYNGADDEHADFYKKNKPQFSDRDFSKAGRSIIAKQAAAEAEQKIRKEYDSKFESVEADKRRKEAEPIVAEAVMNAVEEVFKTVPEFEKLFEPGKLTKEAVDKMAELNPVLHHFASEEAELVMGVIGESERFEALGKHHKYDPSYSVTLGTGRTIHPHVMISEAWRDLEKRMAAAPKSETTDKGAEFVTADEFNRRAQEIARLPVAPEEKQRRIEALEKGTWTISHALVRNFMLSESGKRIKASAKKFGNFTKTPAKDDGNGRGLNGDTPEAEKNPAKSAASRGTSTATESDTTDNSSALGGGVENSTKEFLKSAFGV